MTHPREHELKHELKHERELDTSEQYRSQTQALTQIQSQTSTGAYLKRPTPNPKQVRFVAPAKCLALVVRARGSLLLLLHFPLRWQANKLDGVFHRDKLHFASFVEHNA